MKEPFWTITSAEKKVVVLHFGFYLTTGLAVSSSYLIRVAFFRTPFLE